jgi:hypothetical protein
MSMRMLSWTLVCVIAVGVLVAGCDPALPAGQVLFTTSNTISRMRDCSNADGVPAGCGQGGSGYACSMALAVPSVAAGTDVYAVYVLSERVPWVEGHTNAEVTVTKDGVPYTGRPGGAAGTASDRYTITIYPTNDCLYDPPNQAWSLPVGKYHFAVSLDGKELSQGDLTVN